MKKVREILKRTSKIKILNSKILIIIRKIKKKFNGQRGVMEVKRMVFQLFMFNFLFFC